ncbi:MAG: hypothetical protein ACI3Z9_00025 [Candidatus Onthomorpha sp.]
MRKIKFDVLISCIAILTMLQVFLFFSSGHSNISSFLSIFSATIYILIFCHGVEGVGVKNLTFGGVLSSNACDFSGSGRVEGRLWEYLGFEQVIVF